MLIKIQALQEDQFREQVKAFLKVFHDFENYIG